MKFLYRGARRILDNAAFAELIARGRDFRVSPNDGRKGGAGARLSQSLQEGNRRGSAAITGRKDRSFFSAFARAEYLRSPRVSAGCALAKLRQTLDKLSHNDSEG